MTTQQLCQGSGYQISTMGSPKPETHGSGLAESLHLWLSQQWDVQHRDGRCRCLPSVLQVWSCGCAWPPSHVPIWRDLLLNHILAALAAALLQHSLHGTTDNQLPPSAWMS